MTEAGRGKSVLMLAPAFLADRRHKRVHGVELFNFLLIRGLVEMGVRVTLAAEPRWREGLATHLSGVGEGLEVVYGLPLRRPLPVSLALLPALLGRGAFDLLILGNNGRGILPAAKAMMRFGRAARCVLFAHQYARTDYLRQLRGMALEVHAVSEAVASDFREGGRWPVNVSYGVLNAREFFPAEGGEVADRGAAGRRIKFGVVGQLDTAWKGAHLALEAWAKIPGGLRERAELHLLAYRNPPQIRTPGVVLHEWLAPERVPAFMRTLDALIVPSTSAESFSQVTVQGMLTGLPILAYDLPVLAEKLDAGGGVVFRTSEELAAQIERMIDDDAERLRMGRAARTTALRRYDWKIAEFVDLYLGERPARSHGRGVEESVSRA